MPEPVTVPFEESNEVKTFCVIGLKCAVIVEADCGVTVTTGFIQDGSKETGRLELHPRNENPGFEEAWRSL